jgi:hypothetical protein
LSSNLQHLYSALKVGGTVRCSYQQIQICCCCQLLDLVRLDSVD